MKLNEKKGILYPKKMSPKSWIVTGPPGSGKSWLIQKVGGWPGEVAIDLAMDKWWKVEPLSHRPREVHFVLPFMGFDRSFAVYDERWSETIDFPPVDWKKIKIPNKKKFFLAPNWQERFVFDFIIPPASWTLAQRRRRFESADKRPMDQSPSEAWIFWQTAVHWQAALHFHNAGLRVIVRPFNDARPYTIPVLKKIAVKNKKISKAKPTPDLDWSKTASVKLWLSEANMENKLADS
ncbi:MAG: hypothetical protein HQL67_06865 [Magnetococcales bacterium]|nr:hypothetical protein [Magnetococcales bacterium]